MRASRLTGSVLLAGALAAVLTGALVGAAGSHASASKRAGTIAFIRVAPGPDYVRQLFSVRADGSGLRSVTPRDASVYSYAWSPDGRLIAYIDQRTLSLWLVRPDGTGHRLLLPSSRLSSLGLSWSPDGKAIAIVSRGPSANPFTAVGSKLALYIVPIGSGKPVQVSPPRRGIGRGVAWSPRGNEIAYGDGGEVLGVISRNGGRPRILLSSGVGTPQWSPDGTKLAAPTVIHYYLSADRYRRITAVNADGSDPHVVTDHANTEYPFAWSPDSRQILYGRQDRQGIYVIGADGRGDHRVSRDSPRQAGWGALAWSPDGSSIVYATDRTGNDDLYLIDADGHHKVRLTSSAASESAPSWQPHH
jgi:TolB protein